MNTATKSTAFIVLVMVALGLFISACSSQPQTAGTNPPANGGLNAAPTNAAGDASAQLQNSFDTNLPPDPSAQPQPGDNLSKDLAVN